MTRTSIREYTEAVRGRYLRASKKDKGRILTVNLARLLCEDEDNRQKIADLVTYIETNRDGLYGSRALRDTE